MESTASILSAFKLFKIMPFHISPKTITAKSASAFRGDNVKYFSHISKSHGALESGNVIYPKTKPEEEHHDSETLYTEAGHNNPD